MQKIKSIWRIVKKTEEFLGMELPITFIEIENGNGGLCTVDESGITISIGASLKGKDLKATVLHEIGHALEEIRGAKQFMKPFLSDKNSKKYEGFSYQLATRTFFLWKQLPVPRGFTSLYATLSPSEDWADTFCDVMMNKRFPKNDHKLQAKVLAVKNLIEYLRNQ